MHWVQFSAIQRGVSRRATYLLAVAPVAAAMTLTEERVEAGWK
jgi:hypothetical protein